MTRKYKFILLLLISTLIVLKSRAQEKATNCTSCFNQFMAQQGDYSSHLGLENNAYGNYSLAGGWLSQTTELGRASLAFGYKALAAEDVSFAFGFQASAMADKSFALGSNVTATGAGAKTFGANLNGLAPFTITIGTGYSSETPFVNGKEYSFAIVTKSNRPTLFVGKSPGPMDGTTGKVGIGTMEPMAKLHIHADEGEEASLLIEPYEWTDKTNAVIKLGNEEHQIATDGKHGMMFAVPTNRNFGFLNGKVGIGTNNPQATLDIEGDIRVSSFATEPGHHKIIFADENGMLFTDNIPLYDNMGNHVAEKDIVMNGHWIKHAESDENKGLYISQENRIGIGTSTPTAMLDVRSSNEAEIVAFSMQNKSAGFWAVNNTFAYGFGVDKDGIGHITANVNTPVNVINFYSNGKIGIGNAIPPAGTSHRLFVEGGITSEEVVVNSLTNSKEWPDFVFKKNYELKTLDELKKFIKKEGHLPGVPTAKDIEEKGQNLAKINAVLLEKIEELTLYLMKQQEEIEQLKKSTNEK